MRIKERLIKVKERKDEIEALISDPETMKDQEGFQKLAKELASIRPIVEKFDEYEKLSAEFSDLKNSEDDDPEMQAMIQEESAALESKLTGLNDELESLLLQGTEPNANRDVILEIRAGTGGDEAGLFAADLFRMYQYLAVAKGFKLEVMESSSTEIGGFKEVIFSVSGQNAYSLFKFESGIHRVQRVPDTESSGRIHTSAVTVAVLPEVDASEIEILPKDLRIDVYRASGAGGQHVNKTESAVRITHIPTGFVVSCQDERSQHKNKAQAMRVLRARIFDWKQEQEHQEQAKERKAQVGSGDRSGKIRTYNFPDQRVTDHRIGLTLHSLSDILSGHLDPVIEALWQDEREKRLSE